jgi:Protein of unknown function (DUF3592)
MRATCFVVGPCFFLIGTGFAIHMALFLRNSAATEGVIVTLTSTHDQQINQETFAPVFTFTGADAQNYTITSDTSSNPPAFAVGQHVRVLYENAFPLGARIDSFAQLWTFPMVFGFMGLLATATGCGLLRYERWRDRKAIVAAA